MKLAIFIILSVLIALIGCTLISENPCSLSESVLKEINKQDSLIHDSVIIVRNKEWMESNYDEPSIFKAKHETYRFVLNSFGGSSYTKIVRVEKRVNNYIAIVKEFKSQPGSFEPVSKIDEIELSEKDWKRIMNQFKSDNFWTSFASCDKQLLHGTIWYLEGYKLKKDECTLKNYHRLSGCYPIDSSFVSMCNLLLDIKEE